MYEFNLKIVCLALIAVHIGFLELLRGFFFSLILRSLNTLWAGRSGVRILVWERFSVIRNAYTGSGGLSDFFPGG
jgi:hypothetical protein